MSEQKTFMVEGAQLIFRNFSGKESQYNRNGDRNFSVILDYEMARRLLSDGWNVRELEAREAGDPPVPYIQIAVGYKSRPPRIVLITSTSRMTLDEDQIEMLDYADISNADLIARAYNWEVNGKSGIKAYLQSLYITLEEDALERKYAHRDE